MMAKTVAAILFGAICLLAGFGCSRVETDGAHYGYTGSLPAVCAACED